jgi:hypothetical protein
MLTSISPSTGSRTVISPSSPKASSSPSRKAVAPAPTSAASAVPSVMVISSWGCIGVAIAAPGTAAPEGTGLVFLVSSRRR